MRPLLVLFLIISAIAAFAIDNYGIKFDRGMIANFIETNPAEAASYLSFKSICFVLGLGFIPSLAVCLIPVYYPQSWLKQRMQHLGCGALLISAGLALAMPFYQQIVFLGREHKDIIKILVPSACVGAAWSYFEKNYLQKNQPYVALGQDVRKSLSTDKPRLIFLVVGETARAADYEYMGYARDTNRYTRPDDLINFTKVSSCGTATAQSLPCMFSNLNRSEFDTSLTVNREGLMDVIAKSGAKTIWIDNDGGCKGACDRIPNQMIKADEDPKYCNGSTCTDEVLIKYAAKLAQNIQQDTVIVFHLIGSHGPRYFERYPENKAEFKPECRTADVSSCTRDELVNTYDNTILYTDYVLHELIAKGLKPQEHHTYPALLYISDHGESLGEKGLYLHGTPYAIAPDEQTHIPMQLYLPPHSAAGLKLNRECLQTQRKLPLSHDNLFHSMMGLMGLSSREYDQNLDFFAKCRLQN